MGTVLRVGGHGEWVYVDFVDSVGFRLDRPFNGVIDWEG